ncbi:hypothetical protein BP422_15715 [Brevibacillus formosus]|uniref:Uncharacterized protein n=1 Tax=Brevibacillus formosus TaxID=54913 RepID=A0A220MIG3_9BACL|nr:hypothetical protein [Brevibacillus formosus]ASJ54886.1 hypothetical protein BP422_15715 [Brevibacillus formosus]
MNVNITIQAPELVSAIQALAHSITGNQLIAAGTPQAAPAYVPQPAAVPQAVPTPQQPVQEFYQQQPQIVPPVPPTYQPEQAVPVTPPPIATPAAVPGVVPGAVPTEAPTYTIDQLAVAATQLVDAGRREELVQLLSAFGVQTLTALPKEQFGAFATHLRAMGAKI